VLFHRLFGQLVFKALPVLLLLRSIDFGDTVFHCFQVQISGFYFVKGDFHSIVVLLVVDRVFVFAVLDQRVAVSARAGEVGCVLLADTVVV